MADLFDGDMPGDASAFDLPGDDEILANTTVGQEMAAEQVEAEPEVSAEEPAGQPPDEIGRFAAQQEDSAEEEIPADAETPAPAEPTLDPGLESYLAKYGGDREKALQAAVELQATLGRQAQELGELRSRDQQWEQWAQQQQQQYQQPAPAQNWDDLIAEDPAKATRLAAQMGDRLAFQRAASEWNDISPGAPQAWIEQQEVNARLDQYEQAEKHRAANTAAAQLVEKYPDIGKEEVREKIIELAPQYPHEMAALMSGDIQYVVPALESLFLKTRALNSDTLQEKAQEIARIQAEEEIRVREEAAVASATRTSAEPPVSMAEAIAAEWPTDDPLKAGWNLG